MVPIIIFTVRLYIIRHCPIDISNAHRSYSDDSSRDVANDILNTVRIPIYNHVIKRHRNVDPKKTPISYSVELPKDVAKSIINKRIPIQTEGKESANSAWHCGDPKAISRDIMREYPEKPTTCCQCECANCVWVEYAEKLSEYFKDGGEKAIKLEIERKEENENLKAFILHEIGIRLKQKKKPPE